MKQAFPKFIEATGIEKLFENYRSINLRLLPLISMNFVFVLIPIGVFSIVWFYLAKFPTIFAVILVVRALPSQNTEKSNHSLDLH